MRSAVTREKIGKLIEELGQAAKSPGKIYLVGGATALLLNFREQTIDVDLKADPEPEGIFEKFAELKKTLDINIELASPDQFVPALPGWRERSQFIKKVGQVEFFHYDFYGQAFAKIERNHEQDLLDVRALIQAGLVKPGELNKLISSVSSSLIRYPGIDLEDLQEKLKRVMTEYGQ